MKMLVAILRPEQLPDVKLALMESQIEHFTVTNALGTVPRAEQRMYRGVEQKVSLKQRVRLELVLPDSDVETALDALRSAALDTGGHGIVFITELVDAVLLWNGARGPRAL
jgi:nitrogen regulatory protein P-II 1